MIDWANGGSADVFFMTSMVPFWGIGAILGNGYGI